MAKLAVRFWACNRSWAMASDYHATAVRKLIISVWCSKEVAKDELTNLVLPMEGS